MNGELGRVARSNAARTSLRTVSLSVRTVPSRQTVSGMVLKAVPPWMLPTVTTAASRGSTSRLTMLCRETTIVAAQSRLSTPLWGCAAWAPVPSTTSSNVSSDAIIGPDAINEWAIGATGAGTLNGNSFSGIENLIGGSFTKNLISTTSALQLQLSTVATKTWDGRAITSSGNAYWTDNGQWSALNGATFTNAAAFNLQGDAGIQYLVGVLPTFSNSGTLSKTAGTSSTIGTLVSLSTSISLVSLVSLSTSVTLVALVSLVSLCSSSSRGSISTPVSSRSSGTLITLVSLRTLEALVALISLVALITLWTSILMMVSILMRSSDSRGTSRFPFHINMSSSTPPSLQLDLLPQCWSGAAGRVNGGGGGV